MHVPKRTAAVAAATVVLAGVVGCASAGPATAPAGDPTAAPVATSAASAAPASGVLTAMSPLPVDAYVAQFSASDGSLPDVDAVNEEYRAAAAAFPLALPDGYAWPTETWLRDGQSGAWQQGNGVAQAYFFWQTATANAAFADHIRGNDQAAAEHLDALEAGRSGPVAAMFVQDPGGGYVSQAIAPAREGDWTPLYAQDVQPFREAPSYAAVADRAGDLVDLGTEGFATEVGEQ